jgi:hypothetical protein
MLPAQHPANCVKFLCFSIFRFQQGDYVIIPKWTDKPKTVKQAAKALFTPEPQQLP